MSRWELFVHVVWATQRRQPFLTPEREAAVYRMIVKIADGAGMELVELNGMADHVHLLLRVGPQFDLSVLMKQIKGNSSALLNDMTQHQHHFRWQEGYYAATVTPTHLPKIRAYIQQQKEHHRTGHLSSYWEETGEYEEP